MQTARTLLKYLLRSVGIFVECFFAFLVVFWMVSVVLSRIPSAPEKVAEAKTVKIYINASAVHTDIILPIANEQMNWAAELNLPDSVLQDTALPYLAFGWGEKGFFLETKDWGDLKASVFFKAMFHLGSSAMHVVRMPAPDPNNKSHVVLWLTPKQYEHLVAYIRESFTNGPDKKPVLIPEHPYGVYHYFYESPDSYGLFYTCNSWANDGLKAGGQKGCAWTALKDGITLQYEEQ